MSFAASAAAKTLIATHGDIATMRAAIRDCREAPATHRRADHARRRGWHCDCDGAGAPPRLSRRL